MTLTNFNGAGVGFGFGVGCGFGVGWGFGGMALNFLGLGAGGGCGVGLGLGWGFGSAFGSHYHNSGVTFQGVEFKCKAGEGRDSKNLSNNTKKIHSSSLDWLTETQSVCAVLDSKFRSACHGF